MPRVLMPPDKLNERNREFEQAAAKDAPVPEFCPQMRHTSHPQHHPDVCSSPQQYHKLFIQLPSYGQHMEAFSA